MTVKKMSVNLAKASKKSRVSVSSVLARIAIYSTVVAGIIASLFYDFKLGTLSIFSGTESWEAKGYIASINQMQQAYYAEYGQFSDSLENLYPYQKWDPDPEQLTDDYNYTIASSMGPVQTLQNQREPAQFESAIATATPNDMTTGKSYTAAVFAFKEKGSDMITTIAAICESDRGNASDAQTWNPPTFDGKEIQCQPGTTMLR
jgi:hypothetical protein